MIAEPPLEIEPVPDDLLDQRKAFDEERRRGIFSTDVAAILGLSRYGSPMSVYRAKQGELPPREMSLPAWIGLRLETLVAELYATATGSKLRADNLAHFHPVYTFLGTHLDRRVVKDSGLIVELKTRGSARGWGEDGTADVPPDVWSQVQHEIFCTGARECHVAALFSNSSFRIYRLEPDPAYETNVVPTLVEFWNDHVLAGVPPEITGHDADTAYLRTFEGGDTGFYKLATPEMEEIIAQLRLAYYNAAAAGLAKTELQNRVKVIIGEDADGISGAFGIIHWKRSRPSLKTDWKLVATTLQQAADRLLELANPGEGDPFVDEYALLSSVVRNAESLYTAERPGSRRFTTEFIDS